MTLSIQDRSFSHSLTSLVTALIITSGHKLSFLWMEFNHEFTVYASCFMICFIILNRLNGFNIYRKFGAILEQNRALTTTAMRIPVCKNLCDEFNMLEQTYLKH